MTSGTEQNYVEAARREKRAALEAMGVAAYAYRFARTHTAAEALATYDPSMGDDGPAATVAGRLVAFRSQGKTAFAHVEDESGRVQLYFRQDALGAAFDVVKLLDLDDHVGASGKLFRTRTGETTLRVESLTLLAKSLRPLPRGKVQQTDDGLLIDGVTRLHGGEVDGCNDHRIVMAFAIAALNADGCVTISDAQSIQKSYPTFFEDYNQLGGNAHVVNLG